LLCTSLGILRGRNASRFVHSRSYSVGLLVEVGLCWLGFYLWWGKPRLVTSWSRPSLVVVPKAFAMARLSAVASLLAILPEHPSRFRPLAPYCPISGHLTANPPTQLASNWSPLAGTLLLLTRWHPTGHRRWLASPLPGGSARHLPLRPVGPSSVTPSCGIALPPWLCPTPWIDLMTRLTVHHGFGWPSAGVFLCRRSTILSQRPAFLAVRVFSFVLVGLRKALGLSTCTFLCFVSLSVWGFYLRC